MFVMLSAEWNPSNSERLGSSIITFLASVPALWLVLWKPHTAFRVGQATSVLLFGSWLFLPSLCLKLMYWIPMTFWFFSISMVLPPTSFRSLSIYSNIMLRTEDLSHMKLGTLMFTQLGLLFVSERPPGWTLAHIYGGKDGASRRPERGCIHRQKKEPGRRLCSRNKPGEFKGKTSCLWFWSRVWWGEGRYGQIGKQEWDGGDLGNHIQELHIR